jgi:hypothetical protein
VGSSLVLGTVVIDTTGTASGSHSVSIDHAVDNVSTLGLDGTPEPLVGNAFYSVTTTVPTVSSWGVAAMFGGLLAIGTILLGLHRTRPAL